MGSRRHDRATCPRRLNAPGHQLLLNPCSAERTRSPLPVWFRTLAVALGDRASPGVKRRLAQLLTPAERGDRETAGSAPRQKDSRSASRPLFGHRPPPEMRWSQLARRRPKKLAAIRGADTENARRTSWRARIAFDARRNLLVRRRKRLSLRTQSAINRYFSAVALVPRPISTSAITSKRAVQSNMLHRRSSLINCLHSAGNRAEELNTTSTPASFEGC